MEVVLLTLLGASFSSVVSAQTITEFPIPTPNSDPENIAAGSDGALWFTERFSNRIGRITTAGVITEFNIPTANSHPAGIAAGPDGALWFTEPGGNVGQVEKIGRITTGVVHTPATVPTLSFPMLALLALALAGVGASVMRRQ